MALVLLFLILVLVALIISVIGIAITSIYLSQFIILFRFTLLILTPISLPTTLLLNQLHQLNLHQLPNFHPFPLYLQLTASKPLNRIKHITQTNHSQHQQQHGNSKWHIHTYRWLLPTHCL